LTGGAPGVLCTWEMLTKTGCCCCCCCCCCDAAPNTKRGGAGAPAGAPAAGAASRRRGGGDGLERAGDRRGGCRSAGPAAVCAANTKPMAAAGAGCCGPAATSGCCDATAPEPPASPPLLLASSLRTLSRCSRRPKSSAIPAGSTTNAGLPPGSSSPSWAVPGDQAIGCGLRRRGRLGTVRPGRPALVAAAPERINGLAVVRLVAELGALAPAAAGEGGSPGEAKTKAPAGAAPLAVSGVADSALGGAVALSHDCDTGSENEARVGAAIVRFQLAIGASEDRGRRQQPARLVRIKRL
jgi:hypothetical protein